jgi:hypothetical protein
MNIGSAYLAAALGQAIISPLWWLPRGIGASAVES